MTFGGAVVLFVMNIGLLALNKLSQSMFKYKSLKKNQMLELARSLLQKSQNHIRSKPHSL